MGRRRALTRIAILLILSLSVPCSPHPGGSSLPTRTVPPPSTPPPSSPDPASRLQAALLHAVAAAGFEQVVDTGLVESCPGLTKPVSASPQVAQSPNVDVALIELDAAGRPLAAADVLVSPDHPAGIAVPVGSELSAESVRWRRWGGGDDIVAGRESATVTFTEPYPASTFKLLVAFHVLKLVDQGALSLDQVVRSVARAPEGARRCEPPDASRPLPPTAPVRTLLDRMITASDDQAARTLLKLLHDLHQVDAMNAGLRALGLGTLQVDGTSPADGGRWSVGRITLTSLDTARLLLIVNGSPGVLWHGPDGSPVTADELSATSRSLLKGLLADQAWSDVLSTTDWCGRGYPAVGIPAPVAGRWIDPATGAVTVQGRSFRQDVRPCNDRAEVAFAHKTGWTFNFLADAGIVDSLPGVPSQRHYVVVLLSNLGYRYADAPESSGGNPPCYQGGVCYTQKVAQLGQAIDQLVR